MVQQENDSTFQNSEEIDLYPYFKAVQNSWKKILTITFFVAILTAVGSFFLPKTYRVNALISLGRIEADKTNAPLASLSDINQLIASSSLVKKIIAKSNLDVTEQVNLEERLRKELKAQSKSNSQYIALQYDTKKPEQGIVILNTLIKEIQKAYDPRAENYRKTKDVQIELLKENIGTIDFELNQTKAKTDHLKSQLAPQKELSTINAENLKNQKTALLAQIKSHEERIITLDKAKLKIDSLTSTLEQNVSNLLQGNAEINAKTTDETILTSLFLSNNIQLNIAAINQSKIKLTEYDMAINDSQKQINLLKIELDIIDNKIRQNLIQLDFDIENLQNSIQQNEIAMAQNTPIKIAKVKNSISNINIEKTMIEGIHVVSEPDYLSNPIKPKKIRIVAMTAVLTFFLLICLTLMRTWKTISE